MLRSRAITEGQKAFAPALGGGVKAYTPEELGGEPHEDDLPASAQAATTYIEAEFNVEEPTETEEQREQIVASFNDPRHDPHSSDPDEGLLF